MHISLFQNYGRIQDFNDFCNFTIDIIRPSVVLASGDLTDAKKINHLDSQQFREEWQNYQLALTRSKIAEKTVWLDIRGNHDNFNVANTKYDYYRNYSMQGPVHPRSYSYDLEKDGTKYSFVAIDATLQPGPKRPFNFIGILSANETQHIQDLVEKSKAQNTDKQDHHLFFFSHYPTSCILSPRDGVRKLVSIMSDV
jgi:Calcineurin-like phosphoesterase